MDACTIDHRADLADSLPDYHRHVWLRVLAGDAEETTVAGGFVRTIRCTPELPTI